MLKENIYNTIKAELKNLTNITFVALTKRGNHAIEIALQCAAKMGKKTCIVLDQGGWLSYPDYAKAAQLTVEVFPTKDCKLDLELLKKTLTADKVLIMHSLSGYFYHQPMAEIHKLCMAKGAMLINDCCGSITDPELMHGDIFVCSFGKWKPINHGVGGFIGTRDSSLFYSKIKFNESEVEAVIKDPEDLLSKIKTVYQRVDKLNNKADILIKDLDDAELGYLNIDDELNLAVICPFKENATKQKILEICKKNDMEFEECPREIRVNKQAISIEVKRADTNSPAEFL